MVILRVKGLQLTRRRVHATVGLNTYTGALGVPWYVVGMPGPHMSRQATVPLFAIIGRPRPGRVAYI